MSNATSVSVQRRFSGVLVDGQGLGLELVPGTSGLITIIVRAYPSATGFSHACRMGQEGAQSEFSLADVQIHGNRLECLHGAQRTAFFREGFAVVLEEGMAEPIRQHLPDLARIAEASACIEERIGALMVDRPYRHMGDFITSLLAAIVLDGLSVAEAFKQQSATHFAAKNPAYMSAFRDEQVQALLRSCTATQ